jgi:hypothetical protein
MGPGALTWQAKVARQTEEAGLMAASHLELYCHRGSSAGRRSHHCPGRLQLAMPAIMIKVPNLDKKTARQRNTLPHDTQHEIATPFNYQMCPWGSHSKLQQAALNDR